MSALCGGTFYSSCKIDQKFHQSCLTLESLTVAALIETVAFALVSFDSSTVSTHPLSKCLPHD